MNTVTLADPVTGIGTIAGIDKFGVEDADGKGFTLKDGYGIHRVEPFLRAIGISTPPERLTNAVKAAGIDPNEVFIEVVHVPGLADEDEGLTAEDAVNKADELWVGAFGDLNADGVSTSDIQFVRVA